MWTADIEGEYLEHPSSAISVDLLSSQADLELLWRIYSSVGWRDEVRTKADKRISQLELRMPRQNSDH